MATLETYANKYSTIRMERRDGILQLTFHTDGGSLRWGLIPHGEFPDAFADIARDRENRVVIMTGTGDEFSGVRATPATTSMPTRPTLETIDRIHWEGRALLMNLLNIEVPVISAINGPAWRHGEIPLLSDIVLASETALFQDAPHFMSGIVPGDGAHIVWPHLLGANRGRYFLIMGQEIGAKEALQLGVVSEVVPAGKLMERARQVARYIADMPMLTRRYTRVALTQRLKRLMQEGLGYGLAVEALAAIDQLPAAGRMKDAGR